AIVLLANGGVTITEFVGIGAALELFNIPRFLSVPAAAILVWWLVVKGSYQRVEKVFLVMTLVFFAYPAAAILAGPDWGQPGSLPPDRRKTPVSSPGRPSRPADSCPSPPATRPGSPPPARSKSAEC